MADQGSSQLANVDERMDPTTTTVAKMCAPSRLLQKTPEKGVQLVARRAQTHPKTERSKFAKNDQDYYTHTKRGPVLLTGLGTDTTGNGACSCAP